MSTLFHLRDLGGRNAIPEWGEITWLECSECSGTVYGPCDDDEAIYDGEPVVCIECGTVCSASVDEEGACLADPHGHLTETALAGFRRLLHGRQP